MRSRRRGRFASQPRHCEIGPRHRRERVDSTRNAAWMRIAGAGDIARMRSKIEQAGPLSVENQAGADGAWGAAPWEGGPELGEGREAGAVGRG